MAIDLVANILRKKAAPRLILFTVAVIYLLLCAHSVQAEAADGKEQPLSAPPQGEISTSDGEANDAGNPADGEIIKRNYFYAETDDGYRVFQRLEWPAVPYVLRYEVELERSDGNGGWQLYEEYETTENVLEISLQAGTWRYSVSVINLLDKMVYKTEPREFIIKKAVIPGADDISPSRIYLDEWHNGIILLRGNNFLPETQFSLRKAGSRLNPIDVSIDSRGRRAEITFNEKLFDVGQWMLTAENPGGFLAELPFVVKFQKWYDFSISLGYAPSFAVADDTIRTYFGSAEIWTGIDSRLTFIPMKRRIGYFGIGLDINGMVLNGGTAGYGLSSAFFSGYVCGVYRKPVIKNRLTFEARAGAGLFAVTMLQFSFPSDLQSEQFSSYYLSVMAGGSAQVFVWRTLYIEAGVYGSYSFIPDVALVMVRPSLAVGWQF